MWWKKCREDREALAEQGVHEVHTSEPAGQVGKPEGSRNEDITLNSPGPAARGMGFLCPRGVLVLGLPVLRLCSSIMYSLFHAPPTLHGQDGKRTPGFW